MSDQKSKLPLNFTMAIAVRSGLEENLKLAVAGYKKLPTTTVVKNDHARLERDAKKVAEVTKSVTTTVSYPDWNMMAEMSVEVLEKCIQRLKEFKDWNSSRKVQALSPYDLVMASPDLKLKVGLMLLNVSSEATELVELAPSINDFVRYKISIHKRSWIKAIHNSVGAFGVTTSLVDDLFERSKTIVLDDYKSKASAGTKGAFYDLCMVTAKDEQIRVPAISNQRITGDTKQKSLNVDVCADNLVSIIAKLDVNSDKSYKKFVIAAALLTKCTVKRNVIRQKVESRPKNIFGDEFGQILLIKPIFNGSRLWGFEADNQIYSVETMISDGIANFRFKFALGTSSNSVPFHKVKDEYVLSPSALFEGTLTNKANNKQIWAVSRNAKVCEFLRNVGQSNDLSEFRTKITFGVTDEEAEFYKDHSFYGDEADDAATNGEAAQTEETKG